MKKLMTLAIIMTTLSFSAFAAPQAEEANPSNATCVAAPNPDGSAADLEAFLNANGPDAAANPSWGYWHCTAYAEGHGHSWGFDYRDVHYNHAYWGAVQRCEYNTHHHCHDVHCHYDHH